MQNAFKISRPNTTFCVSLLVPLLVSGLVLGLVSMTGCGDDSGSDAAVDSGRRDSGRFDSSTFDSGAPGDGATDSGATDSSTSDSAPGDGGTATVVVDGVISPSEWDGALEATNGVASSWGTNTLTHVRALVADGRLYLAVDAALEAGAENAVVLYIDNERASGSGVTDPADLTDTDGALDNALSAAITTPSDFQADFAWGTRDLSRVADAFDDRMGFRDVATNPADFAWVDSTEAPTVCSATVCEASILLSALGGAGPIGVFARLVNTDGTDASNQCLPEDDVANPDVVSVILAVPR